MLFKKGKEAEWNELSLKEFLRGTIFSDHDQNNIRLPEEVEKSFNALSKDAINQNTENAKQVDSHLIYIAAGALFATTQLSNKMIRINADSIALCFLFFALCIICVIASYFTSQKSLWHTNQIAHLGVPFNKAIMILSAAIASRGSKMLEAFKAFVCSDQVSFSDTTIDHYFDDANMKWQQISSSGYWGAFWGRLVPKCNLFAYASFFFAMLTLIYIGIRFLLPLITSPQIHFYTY